MLFWLSDTARVTEYPEAGQVNKGYMIVDRLFTY